MIDDRCLYSDDFQPEELIFEETLEQLRVAPISPCINVAYDDEGNELIKITCRPDRPVIYRVCEMDLQSCTFLLRFPD